jgi:hypothetical protein
VGGPISLAETLGGGYEVVNQTAFPLYGAGVIRKNARGQIETAWIGTLEPGAAADLEFSRSWDAEAAGSFWTDQRNRAALTARNAPPDQLNLCQLVELAEDPREVIVEGGRQVVRTPAPQSGYGYRIAVSGPPRLHRLGLRPGDVRLVAWLDQRIPGLEIKPAAPQSRHAALVVAHLRYGHGQDPQPDFTTLRELKGRDGRRVFETF